VETPGFDTCIPTRIVDGGRKILLSGIKAYLNFESRIDHIGELVGSIIFNGWLQVAEFRFVIVKKTAEKSLGLVLE
jgi:hypothetical protein